MESIKVYLDDRLAIVRDTDTGKFYMAIPVSNGLVDYDEWYAIPQEWAKSPDDHLTELRAYAARARRREVDDQLLLQPGPKRGTPT